MWKKITYVIYVNNINRKFQYINVMKNRWTIEISSIKGIFISVYMYRIMMIIKNDVSVFGCLFCFICFFWLFVCFFFHNRPDMSKITRNADGLWNLRKIYDMKMAPEEAWIKVKLTRKPQPYRYTRQVYLKPEWSGREQQRSLVTA